MSAIYTLLTRLKNSVENSIHSVRFLHRKQVNRERNLTPLLIPANNQNQATITQNQLQMQTFTSNSTATSSNRFTRWITFSLLAMLAILSTNSFGQINYSRTTLTGQTYTPLTGGGITTINTTAQLTAGVMSVTQDDGAAIVTLPFTWTYNGNTFTQVTFCTNGWIGAGDQSLVTAAQGRGGGNLFSTTVPNNTIGAWFKDMGANFPLGTGSMRHGLIGTEVYAFQWNNAIGSGFSDGTTNTISFQINIYGPLSTNPGRIEIIYGPQANTLATAAAIGIENATGGSGNFINALTNDKTSTTTSSAWPGNGNGYRFDPLFPCVTPSAAPTALVQGATTISSITASFTASPATDSFLVVRYATGATPTNPVDGTSYIAGSSLGTGTVVSASSSNSFTASGLANSTTYDFYVYSFNGTCLGGPKYYTASSLFASFSTNAPGAISSTTAGGPWNQTTTWVGGVIPTSNDNVTIATDPGFSVVVNISSAVANNITVNGTLEYDPTSAGILTVNNNVTVSSTGTFQTSQSGSQAGHGLVLGGNIVNDGILNFHAYDGTNTTGVTITFTGTGNSTFTGTGATTNLFALTMSKAAQAQVVDINTSNFTVRASVTPAPNVGILLTSGAGTGTLKFSGAATFSGRLWSAAAYTIPATLGIWINNANFTVVGQNGNATVNGLFRLSAGTYTFGTTAGNAVGSAATASYIIEGGTLNIASIFNTANAATFNMSAGTINVTTVGNASTTTAGFGFTSTTSSFTWSGGTINLVQASTGATPYDYRVLATTPNVTGTGVLNVGTGATATNYNFRIQGAIPDLNVDNTTNAKTASVILGTTTIFGTATVTSGATLSANGFNLVFRGAIANSGTVNGSTASSTLTFQGTAAQTLGGAVTGPVPTVVVNNAAGVTITPSVSISSALTLTAGNLSSGGTITLGAGAATGFTFISSGGTLSGTVALNYGTGTRNFTYNSSTGSQTTGAELPASVATGTLTINNTFTGGSVTLNSALSIQNLVLTAGKLNTSASNLLTVLGTTTGSVSGGSATAYVSGPLSRSLPTGLTGLSTYSWPVGKAQYNLLTLAPNTTAATTMQVEVFDADPVASGGFTLTNNRYWQISPVANITGDNLFVTLTESGLTANSRVGQLVGTSPTGTYANFGGNLGSGTITNNVILNNLGSGANSTYLITGTVAPFTAGIYAVGPTANAGTLQPDGITLYDGFFPNLITAINTINSATPSTGNVVFELQNDYVPEASFLNITYQGTASAGLTIRPRSDLPGTLTIEANNTGIIRFNGAKYVTIDGRPGATGSTKGLVINNLSVVAGQSTIEFSNDAQNNAVKYCTIRGNSASTTAGTITFLTAASGGTGNDNNVIDNNDIREGTVTPANAIYASGSTATVAANNSTVTISNNNIYNYFAAAIASNGISISSGNTDWTISNNKFFQQAARTQTTGALHTAITINNTTSGNNFSITGNTIGFADANGTGTYTLSGSTNTFMGINLSVGTTTASVAQNNTIASISQTTASTGTNPFIGIYVASGLTADFTGNTIGSMSATGSISYTNSTTSTTSVNAMYNFGSSNWLNVSNNNIGGITAANTNVVPAAANIYGIRTNTAAAATFTALNNTIGGTIANSIQSTSTNTGSIVNGIISTAAVPGIFNNTIRNLSAANGTNLAGIVVTSTGANGTVSGNTISALTNTNTGAGAFAVNGISFTGTSGVHTIDKNFIYGLSSAATSGATLTGINIGGGTGTYQNNRIALGNGLNTGHIIYGINETAGTDSIRFNTVYIGGAPTTNSANTFAFRSTVTTNVRAVQNNIFFNARSNSGSTGKHYAINVAGTAPNPAGLTSNYNLLFAPGTGGFAGLFNGTDYALATWQTATGQDANSISADPYLAAPTAATPDLKLTDNGGLGSPADGTGVLIATVTDDFESETRASLSPTDIGADAGNYFANYPDLSLFAFTNPTATSCHSATENVVVTVKNNSGVLIDFAVTPATVTANVTGAITAGPLTFALNSGTLAAGASQSVTVGTINTTANGTYNFNLNVNFDAPNNSIDLNQTNNTVTPSVIINYTPLTVTATAGTPTNCQTGSSTLNAVAAGGTTPYATYAWNAGVTPSTASNSTGTITSTTVYTVTVTDACAVTAQGSVTVTVNNPAVTPGTAPSRCGPGTVTFTATPSVGATINWYAAASGGSPLVTGVSGVGNVNYQTTISGPTSVWAAAVIDGGNEFGGKLSSPGTDGSFISTNYGIVFSSVSGFTLNSTVIYPTGTGTITIALYNSSGTELFATAPVSVTGSGISTPVTVPLGFTVAAGTGYRLLVKAYTGITNIIRDFTNTFPYNSPSGNLSVTGGWTGSASTAHYFFYNLNISAGCESARTQITAGYTTPPAITATALPATICAGQSTTLAVSSSNDPNYTYTWSPAGPGSVSPTTNTTYTVNAIDNTAGAFAGCTATTTVNVVVNALPTGVSATPSATFVCPGGTIDLNANAGGGGQIVVQDFNAANGWTVNSAGTSPTASNWALYTSGFTTANGGNFALANSDAGGSGTTTDTRIVSPVFALAAGVTSASLSFEHSYEYYSSGDVTVQVQLSTDGGLTYPVVLADYLGTTVGTSTTTVAATPISLNAYIGQSNLRIRFNYVSSWGYYWAIDDVQVNAIAPSLSYAWTSSPATTFTPNNVASITNITPGASPITYSVVVTNTATNCAAAPVTTVAITTSDLAIAATPTAVSCFGGNNGQVSAPATGGTGPYSYTIAGPTVNATGASTGTFTGLTAGSYTVTVTDAASCSVTSTSVTVTEPAAALAVSITGSTNPGCYNTSDGTVTALATDGTAGYTYIINGPTVNATGASSGTFTGLAAGSYTVTATDANGCTATSAPVVLTAPSAPSLSVSNSGPVCAGSNVTVTATSGFSSYAWSGGSFVNATVNPATTDVAPADQDVLSVIATDGNGCTVSASTTVTVNPNLPVSVSIAVTPGSSICPDVEATFTATPTNGGGSPAYQWYLNGSPLSGETAATYVTTTLANNDQVYVELTSSETCTSGNPANSNTITMTVAGVFASVTLTSSANPSCGGNPVTFTATPTGGGATPNYEFFVNTLSVYSGPLNTYTYTPNDNDVIYVDMTSSLACLENGPTVSSAQITQVVNPTPAAPVITAGGALTFCDGGSVTLTSDYVGGNTWSTAETTDAITVTTSGSYTVVQTQLGCPSAPSAPVVVTVNPNPVVNITGTLSFCTGSNTVLTANVTAGGPATSYVWKLNGVATGGTASTETVTTPGDYTVEVTNGFSCTAVSAQVTVAELTPPTAGVTANCTTLIPGAAATLTATPASGVTYSWSAGGPVLSTANPYTTAVNAAGTYTVTVTAPNTCTSTASVVISNLSGPLAAGTYPIPGGTCGFPTINSAVSYINGNGIGGAVIFDVAAGYTETAPVGGIVLGSATLNPTLSATNTLTFQKAGAGANPRVNAPIGTNASTSTTTVDGIFAIDGSDYVTFDAIDLQDNNASGNAMMEYGYGFFKPSATDGNQFNTIKNCVVTLNKANNTGIGSRGIWFTNVTRSAIGTGLVIATATGRNDNNTIVSNTVQNCLVPILMTGYGDIVSPYTYLDQNNTIGGTSAPLGNTLRNFGTGLVAIAGLSTGNQNNLLIQYNNVNNLAGGGSVHGATLVGISSSATSAITNATVNVKNNTITLAQGTNTGQTQGISVGGVGGTGTTNITDNTITGFTNTSPGTGGTVFGTVVSNAAGTTLNITGNTFSNNQIAAGLFMISLQASATAANVNINNNTITNTTMTNGNAPTLISNTAPVTTAININNNTINGLTYAAANSAASVMISNTAAGSGASLSASGNIFQNITYNVAATGAMTFISNTALTPTTFNYNSNQFNNLTLNTTGNVTFFGAAGTLPATTVMNMNNNTIGTQFTKSGAGGAIVIRTSASSTPAGAVMNFQNNNFSNMTFSGVTTFSGYNDNDGGAPTKVITGNTLSNINGGTGTISVLYAGFNGTGTNISNNIVGPVTSQGAITGITLAGSGTSTTQTLSNNTVTGLTSNGAGGAVIGISVSAAASVGTTVTNNTITSLSSTSGNVTGLTSGATVPTISGNTISSLSSAGASSIVTGLGVTGGTTVIANNNLVHTLSGSGATTPVVNGIAVSGGTTVSLLKNKVYNLSQVAAIASATVPGVNGVNITAGTTVNVINNIIGDLRAPLANTAEAIRGIAVNSTTTSSTRNIYYNTVNIAATSTGAVFGTTGIYHLTSATATTSALNMRNNIIVNTSTPVAAGLTVAYRRSSATSTNYASSSNNNLFYAGTPGASRLIFSDGTNNLDNMPAYKGLLGSPYELNSITEAPNFLSTAGANANFLHIDPSIATAIESGAANIPGTTDDFDGDIRFGNPGYVAGSTTGTDIGADEFNGTSPACTTADGGLIATNVVNLCSANTATTMVSSGATTGGSISYQWLVSSTSGSGYLPVTGGSGASSTSYTTPNNLAAGTYYYVLQTTCSAPVIPVVDLSNEVTVTVLQTPVITAVNPTLSACIGSPIALDATTVTGPVTTYAWTGPGTIVNASSEDASVASAVAGSAGTYSLVATNTGVISCPSTAATVVVTVNPVPAVTAVASPIPVCIGDPVTLTGTASLPLTVTGSVSGDDASSTITTLPFPITFYGTVYNTAYVHSNGFVSFTSGQPTGSPYVETVPTAATPNNYVAISHDDLNVTGGGVVNYFTSGNTPNRVLVVEYNAVKYYNSASNNGNLTGQIQFFESDGHIEVHVQNSVDPTLSPKTLGLENATGTVGASAPGRNNVNYDITAPEAWSFTPAGPNYNVAPVTFGMISPIVTTGITYTWTGPDAIANATALNTTVPSATTAGTYSLKATVTATGCSTTVATAAVAFKTQPTGTITAGTVTIPVPASTPITIAVTGTGPWNGTLLPGNIPFSGTISPITVNVTPAVTTTYTIGTLSDANCTSQAGNLSGSATVTVANLGAPTVNVTQPTCVSATGTITVSAPVVAGYSYSIDGTNYVLNGTVFNNVLPGSYSVTYKDLNNFVSPATSVTVNPQPFTPAQPGVIQGISNVCPYIGTPTQLTYSVVAVPGATSYTWVVPPTVTLVSGQGTNSILVTIGAGFVANPNKLMKVKASSVCGTSIDREFWLKAQFPTTPSPIVASTLDVCPSIGTNVPITYTINAVAATSYIWSAGPGTTITHPYTGANDTTVTVTFSNAFATSAITVQAVNSCGLSGIRSFTITRNNPGLPGLISGPTNACLNISPSITPATYSVAPVANATSYNWTVPAGAIGLTGQGTNTISFIYPSGFTTGTVSVAAVNGCGTSGLRSLAIATLNPATPGVIDVQNLTPCPTRTYSYTIATYPANAADVVWTIPAGATLVSGQGTTSITVSYPNTAVNGTVTVQAVNNCGVSVTRVVTVKLPACPVEPPPPFAATNNPTVKGNVEVVAEPMNVNVYPNPTTTDFKLQVITAGKEEISVRVLDMAGRFIKQVTVMPYQTINIGSELKAGAYLIEVRQGKSVKTTRVLKF